MAKKKSKRVTSGAVLYHTGKFPPAHIDYERLVPLIGPANAALARYDGLLSAIPNAEILLSPLTTHEAVLSSRIEGTQATMGEVLEYEATKVASSPEKEADIKEVLNYRRALTDAVDSLDELPLFSRVIKQVHSTLLEGVRGHDKSRGNYRKIQNYIGTHGCTIEEARFVPTEPEQVSKAMTCWEEYLHSDQPDKLIQLAIVHAEFESIHPFLDGNGRVGRILIPLYLFEQQLLQTPMFYLSEYLEKHRQEYYDRLLAVSQNDDWTGWCHFFLKAITAQAEINQLKAIGILTLYDEKKAIIVDATKSKYSIAVLDFLFICPVFTSSEFYEDSGIPKATSHRILRQLTNEGTLKLLRKPKGKQPSIYIFPELFNIAEGRKVF